MCKMNLKKQLIPKIIAFLWANIIDAQTRNRHLVWEKNALNFRGSNQKFRIHQLWIEKFEQFERNKTSFLEICREHNLIFAERNSFSSFQVTPLTSHEWNYFKIFSLRNYSLSLCQKSEYVLHIWCLMHGAKVISSLWTSIN